MTVYELNQSQLDVLKEHYISRKLEEQNETPSYSELLDSHDIDNEIIYKEYESYCFFEDDFY